MITFKDEVFKEIDINWKDIELEFACDLIELLVLKSPDKRYSFEDVVDFAEDQEKFEEDADSQAKSSRDDKLKSLKNIFKNHIRVRIDRYGVNYPFQFSAFERALEMKDSDLFSNDIYDQKLYVYLLISSVFSVFDKSSIVILGHKFEQLSRYVVQGLVPKGFISEVVGSGGKSKDSGLVSPNLRSKVIQYASDLKIYTHPELDEMIKEKNYGDNGLDIISINKELFETTSHQLFFFAQCACGDNWDDKQFDCYESRWGKLLWFNTPPVYLFLTPKSIRRNDWKFSHLGKIAKHNVFIDRYLIIKLLRNIDPSEKNQILELYKDTNHLFDD